MANVGSLVVDLALESAQFIAGLRNASRATQQTASQITNAMNIAKNAAIGFAGGFIGAFSFDILQERIQEAFDYGDAIVDLADRTGATTKTIQEFRYAAQLSGSSVENADAAVGKFAKNLGAAQNGNKALTKTFHDLGVRSADTDTALKQAMDGIAKLGTVTARNQKTIELFGKSAGDLTLLMSDGSKGFNTLADAAESYGIVLDDHLLRNGGQVNDQLDTMKMIVNAQMAGAIIQNADALMALANAFTQAATAAANFFAQMDVQKLMSTQQSNPLKWDVPHVIGARMSGKSIEQMQADDRAELKKTKAGRQALHDDLTRRYNDNIRAGRNKNDPDMQAMRGEREDIARLEARSRHGLRVTPTKSTNALLPKPDAASKKKTGQTLKSDGELSAAWDRTFLGARADLYRSQERMTNDPTERQDLAAKQIRNRYYMNADDIDMQTGSDKEVREGKKRYTAAQAKLLKEIEREIFNTEYDATIRDRDAEIARDQLDLALAGKQLDADMLSAEMALTRSTRDRRDKSLALVRNQFDQERLQLEHTIELEKLGKATRAEREAAEARLKALPALQSLAEDGVRHQNQSPLEAYLDAIPKTTDELNDAFENVEVEGLKSLQDGLMGIIDGTKSVGEAFTSMSKTIINGLINIGLQQAIIKPLGNLLFGGGEGGGSGLLGSIFGNLLKGLKGARANGGMTSPGNYLVGERGPEVVGIGANARVTNNRELRSLAANDNAGGLHININGPITSNDPAMVRAMVAEGVMSAVPLITRQATDSTLKKLQRRTI
ncbi:hypothetical protein [Sphingomonas sp. Leaf257]|jgi:hypothetical protein|uniref:hypothetical protein n=1 Tax=Sphingomonas sp. Leaf257 TaxID=1736309 RepID=UPI000AB57A65|nr:hypothetical protein [Sphingomonas sp. Leaf257]